MVISKGLRQAYDMQDFAYEAAMAMKSALTLTEGEHAGKLAAPSKEDASAIGVIGKVWKDAQEQIRIHRGKPLPGSLSHEKVKRPGRAGRGQLSTLLSSLPEEQPAAEPPSHD